MQETWNVPTPLREAMNLAVGDRTDRELVSTVKELVRLESAVRATLCHAVAIAIAQCAAEGAGQATAADLLRSECHLSGREANELAVAAVRLREQLHCTLAALQSGAITWAHAATLVRAVDRLGLDTVRDNEHDWIELIATRTGPEALQRVVHTRHVEQVGYPARPTPESEVEDFQTPADAPETGADTSTSAREANVVDNASPAQEPAETDETPRTCGPIDTPREPVAELDNFRRRPQPAAASDMESDTATVPVQPLSSASTLSSDIGSIEESAPASSSNGCMHQGCMTGALVRDITFTVHWLDGSRSTVPGHGLLCDEHATALTGCPVDEIRVGHPTTIRAIDPAPAMDAA